MNDIAFDCQHCGQSLEIDDDAAGTELPCPACENTIEIPVRTVVSEVSAKIRIKDRSASNEIIALSCNSCGAQLDLSQGDDCVTCLFCGGSSIVIQPSSEVSKLRDLEGSSLSVSYFEPAISAENAQKLVLDAIAAEDGGFKDPGSLIMESKGIHFPAWSIDVTVGCSWHGEYSEQRSVTKWRKVRKNSGGLSYEVDEPYTDTEVIWHPRSGSHTFSTSLHTPAVSGFSLHQLKAASAGGGHFGDRRGHPSSAPHFAVARPGKSQREAWDEFKCDAQIENQARAACKSCIERLKSVASVASNKEFSLIYFPVAVVHYTANGNDYRHFVNLRTGALSGDIPLDHDTIWAEAKLAGLKQKRLEARRWLVCLVGFPYMAILGTVIYYGINPVEDPRWTISFIGVTLVGYMLWSPKAEPWKKFLWRRRAYLVRLLLKPPEVLGPAMQAGSATLGANGGKIQKMVQKLADENALEALPESKIIAFITYSGYALLLAICPAATRRIPAFLKALLVVIVTGALVLFKCSDIETGRIASNGLPAAPSAPVPPLASPPIASPPEDVNTKLDPKDYRLTSILLDSPSLAVINGRPYAEGEFLKHSKSSTSKAKIQVKNIRAGSVMLEGNGQQIIVEKTAPGPATALSETAPVSAGAPQESVIRQGAKIVAGEKISGNAFRRGETHVSRGKGGVRPGTTVYPVKFDGIEGYPLYYLKDEFGDWRVFSEALDFTLEIK